VGLLQRKATGAGLDASWDVSGLARFCDPVPPVAFVQALLRAGFSPGGYRDRYADLRALDWGPAEATLHYLSHGLAERRTAGAAVDASGLLALADLPLGDTGFRARLLGGLALDLFEGAAPPYAPLLRERWDLVRALAQRGARAFVVAGDSHSGHFRVTDAREGAWLLPVPLLCTGGSAAGLANGASRSGYGAMLKEAFATLAGLPGGGEVPVLVQFGQVDIEFVHHFRRVRDGAVMLDLAAYRAFCAETVTRYGGYLAGAFPPRRRSRVFLVSVFPPVLSETAWREGYVNEDISRREGEEALAALSAGIRRLHVANLRQRTAIHLHFNALLQAEAARLGFGFVDAASPFLGEDGLADPSYSPPEAAGREHHLDSRRTHGAASALLWRCLDTRAPAPRPGLLAALRGLLGGR